MGGLDEGMKQQYWEDNKIYLKKERERERDLKEIDGYEVIKQKGK